MDCEHICTNRRHGPKTGCLLRRTEDRAKTVSFETPNTVFTNLDDDGRLATPRCIVPFVRYRYVVHYWYSTGGFDKIVIKFNGIEFFWR